MKLSAVRLFTLAALLLTHHLAWAAAGTETTIGNAKHLTSVFLGLLLIIVLIFLLAWFYRKASGGNWLNSGAMRILATLPLGTRERLLLVDVDGTQMLLGVTGQTINCLHVFDEPVISDSEVPASSAFQEKLQALMNGKRATEKPISGSASDDAPLA